MVGQSCFVDEHKLEAVAGIGEECLVPMNKHGTSADDRWEVLPIESVERERKRKLVGTVAEDWEDLDTIVEDDELRKWFVGKAKDAHDVGSLKSEWGLAEKESAESEKLR